MKAVVFKATREVVVEDVPDASVERDDDVVVRVTSSALCGTDLHMYEGRTGATPGMVLGHEGLGTVEEVGRAVQRVRRGDRVVLPAYLLRCVLQLCARRQRRVPAGASGACGWRVRDAGHGAVPRFAGGAGAGSVRRCELCGAARCPR